MTLSKRIAVYQCFEGCWEGLGAGGEMKTTVDEMAGWHDQLDVSLSELWELVIDREAWHAAIHWVAKSQTRMRD